MNISSQPFKLAGPQKESCYIKLSNCLKAAEAEKLRQAIAVCNVIDYETIYVDVKDILEADLSGINEIINSHYTLKNASKQLIVLYKRNSTIEKWLEVTGIDKFIETAILPASVAA